MQTKTDSRAAAAWLPRSRWDQSRVIKSWRVAAEQRLAKRLEHIVFSDGAVEIWHECEGRYAVNLKGRTMAEAGTLFGAELEAAKPLRRFAQ